MFYTQGHLKNKAEIMKTSLLVFRNKLCVMIATPAFTLHGTLSALSLNLPETFCPRRVGSATWSSARLVFAQFSDGFNMIP